MQTLTKPRWLLLLLSMLAALTLTLAACGGDDDDGGGDDGGNGTEVPTETEDTGGDGGGDDGGGNSGDADFGKLSSGWQDVEAKVTYDYTTTDSSGTSTTTMTYYNSPPNSRTDFEDESGEVTTFIQTEENSYICSQEQCLATPGAGVNPFPFFSSFAPEALEVYSGIAGFDTDSGEEEIAGISAKCFSLEQSGVSLKWCFGDDGILLLNSTESAGSGFEMRAIEISTDVSAADFEPPYEVSEIPDIGDIGQ